MVWCRRKRRCVGLFLKQCVTLTKLALRLSWFILPHNSLVWVVMVSKLMVFALALSPALGSSASYWLLRVRKNVPYGSGPRQLLDIYESRPAAGAAALTPVVVFLTGGAWVIGYKAWAVPLGRALSAQGVTVVAPDYRNAPQANVEEMLADCERAIEWTLANVGRYGGDPSKVVLAGQSAGAHLCALLLLRRAEQRKKGWVKGFVGISGPYHVEATAVHWIARGLSAAIFDWIFQGDLSKYSPTDECRRLLLLGPKVGTFLPPVCLVHGTADMSAPSVTSELFEARLRLLGADVLPTKLYKDWSHTDPILEKPFSGDHSLHADVFDLVQTWTAAPRKDQRTTTLGEDDDHRNYFFKSRGLLASLFPPSRCRDDDDDDKGSSRKIPRTEGTTTTGGGRKKTSFDHAAPGCRRLAPQFLIEFGRWCMPF